MRKQSAFLFVVILVAAALTLAACGGKASGPTEVHVTLTEFRIEMDKTSVPAGPVTFIIDNTGAVVHEVVLEPVGAKDEPFEVGGKKSEAEDIDAGKSAMLEWTIDQAGQYQLACYVPGHFEAGMVTTFTVTAP